MFNNLLRSNKKNSDIENILNDDIYSSNIINKVNNPVIYNDVYGRDHCPIGIGLDR